MYVFTNVTNIYTHETIIEKRVYKCEHEWLHLISCLHTDNEHSGFSC